MSEEQTIVAQPVPEATVDPVGPEQQTEQNQPLEVGNLIAEVRNIVVAHKLPSKSFLKFAKKSRKHVFHN